MAGLLFVVVLNPILGTFLVLALATGLLTCTRLRSLRRPILATAGIALAVYFIVDSAFAYRRDAYARQISVAPAIHHTIASPRSVVLVGLACGRDCLERLIEGTFDGVTVIRNPSSPPGPPLRYRLVRNEAKDCPADSLLRAENAWGRTTVEALRGRAICAMIEQTDTPSEGIFVVHEWVAARATESAVEFSPEYTVAHPPSAVIRFGALEVQRRSSTGIEVLGETRYYEAPGYLGFPPLVGCWERPDNIVWIMPAGNSGCGFWRRIVIGGDPDRVSDASWVYSAVLSGSSP
jgi:hypothetical protein